MEEVMPKFASSRTCGSQIGRNGGKWRVGGHGHQVASLGAQRKENNIHTRHFLSIARLCAPHLARMTSLVHLVALEAGVSSHGREGS